MIEIIVIAAMLLAIAAAPIMEVLRGNSLELVDIVAQQIVKGHSDAKNIVDQGWGKWSDIFILSMILFVCTLPATLGHGWKVMAISLPLFFITFGFGIVKRWTDSLFAVYQGKEDEFDVHNRPFKVPPMQDLAVKVNNPHFSNLLRGIWFIPAGAVLGYASQSIIYGVVSGLILLTGIEMGALICKYIPRKVKDKLALWEVKGFAPLGDDHRVMEACRGEWSSVLLSVWSITYYLVWVV